ncbi:MAG: hypothetical protein Q4B96_05445 [Bacillota bacterium]|nr:hypothetical protein [Bacillota bacterium]
MRQGKITYIFPGSNTSQGFVSHYRDGLLGLEHVFILKGGPGCGKSTLMRRVGALLLERGFDCEFWQCSSDNDSLDGVVCAELSLALVDGTAPHTLDPRYPGVVESIVDLGVCWDEQQLRQHKRQIIDLNERIAAHYAEAYRLLGEAGDLAERRAAGNAEACDDAAVAAACAELGDAVFRVGQSRCRHLFASALTPRGVVDLCASISADAEHRYVICGASGCGKERLLAQLAARADGGGHRADIYHSYLRPEQIKLIMLPELRTALLDGGEDEAAFARGKNDIVIDGAAWLRGAAVPADERVQQLSDAAAAAVAEAKQLHDQLEDYYVRAMDFEISDMLAQRLIERIMLLAADK